MVIDKDISKITCNDNLPRIVNAICITLVFLALIYTIYSYLLTLIEVAQQPLTVELETIQQQLDEVQKKERILADEKANLVSQLEKQTQEIVGLQTQLQKVKESEQRPADAQVCAVEPENLDEKFIHNALKKTLSRRPNERMEGFSILMNNLDYMNTPLQDQVVQFYLAEMNPKNKDGVYYATFILSELKPEVLKRYEFEIDETFYFIHEGSDWQKTFHKYCKIENKMYDPPVGSDVLAQKKH
jgi:uncharacterized protein YoxC